jgi:hypothetical protein
MKGRDKRVTTRELNTTESDFYTFCTCIEHLRYVTLTWYKVQTKNGAGMYFCIVSNVTNSSYGRLYDTYDSIAAVLAVDASVRRWCH